MSTFNDIKKKLIGYRYDDQTTRDVRALTENFKGLKMRDQESFIHSNGSKEDCVSLSGTIPVQIRGKIYNIPVVIWLRQRHPFVPPLVYVHPTDNMGIQQSPFVDANGLVYLPYISEWKQGSSDLTMLVQIMCATFADHCPVYSKKAVPIRQTLSHGPIQPIQPPYPQPRLIRNRVKVSVSKVTSDQYDRLHSNVSEIKKIAKPIGMIVVTAQDSLKAVRTQINHFTNLVSQDGNVELAITWRFIDVAMTGRVDCMFQVLPEQEDMMYIGDMLGDGLFVVELDSPSPATPEAIPRNTLSLQTDDSLPTVIQPQPVDTDSEETDVYAHGQSNLQKAQVDAVMSGNVTKVEEYHSKGAKLTAADSNEWTPLYHASKLDNEDVVQYNVVDNGQEAELKKKPEERNEFKI